MLFEQYLHRYIILYHRLHKFASRHFHEFSSLCYCVLHKGQAAGSARLHDRDFGILRDQANCPTGIVLQF